MGKGFKPIKVEGSTLSCGNTSWPPIKVLVYGNDLEAIRSEVSQQEYHKLKTWERVCGLVEMSSEKCPFCPHVLVDGTGKNTFGTGLRVQLGIHTPRRPKRGM